MQRICSAPSCEKPSRSPGSELCKMHYHRQYRHGADVSANQTSVTASHGRRYRYLYLPKHPLAAKNGKVYEHRAVLYDVIQAGPHACHWCGVPVDWLPRGHENELQVDHLNGIGDDNAPANLVPSCRYCNVRRAAQKRSAALRAAGWWSQHDTIARLHSAPRKPPVVARGGGDQFALFGLGA